MQQQQAAALIGGIFGLVFVLANSGPPLSTATVLALRIAAIAALGAIVVRIAVVVRSAPGGERQRDTQSSDGNGMQLFSQRYWLIVVGEVALLVIGLQVLRALGAPQQASVAWIVLVVGLHFLAFGAADVWPRREALSGVVFVAFGVAGLAMAGTDAVRWVPFVSGVLPGLMLLLASWLSATR